MFRKTVKFQQVLELKNDGPKKSRAFRIHSNMSRHEMPNKLKKMIVSCLGNIKFLAGVWNEKMTGPKKKRYSRFTQKLL